MTEKYSMAWKSSTQRRKQRKYRYNAPLHIRQKMAHTHLSPELRTKHGMRNIQVRSGDKVKVMRGQFAKREGKVDAVNLKKSKVFVAGVETIKKDGTKLRAPLDPSNLMIVELNVSDKRRQEKLNKKLPSKHQETKK